MAMYDDDDFRNQYDDDFYGRNALVNRKRRPQVPPQQSYYPPAPWNQPPPPQQPSRWMNNLRLGLIIDAAAQVLAAMASLPAAPVATGDGKTDMTNLITYQQALAQHAKRDEQIRTAGALGRLFLV